MNRLRRWLLSNPVAPARVQPVRRPRLGAEQLEAREVPAAPVAVNDFYELGRNGAVSGNVLGNDYDPNGGTLSANLLSGPLHGSLSLSPSGDFTYVPLPGYVGQDAALYDAVNSAGEMASASIQFYVQSIPHDPVVQNEIFYTAPNTPVSGNVLANDSDPYGDTLTAMVAGSPSGGGSLNFQPDGSFTFTPSGGNSSTIPYAVTNQSGGIAYGYLTIIVEPPPPTNQPPVAEGEFYYTAPGVPISGNLLANDSDLDGDPLTATLVGGSYAGVLTLDPGGSFTYLPGAEGVAWFAYSVSDGRGGSATTAAYIYIEPAANQPPSAVADALTTRFGTPGSVNVLANDSDPDGDPLSVSAYTQPTNGSVAIDSTGLATYTPAAGFSGSDAFTYTVADGKGGTATGTVAVTVAPPPTVTVTSSTTASEAGATAQLTFARTDTVGDLVVNFTAGGSAVSGAKGDYTLSAGTLVAGIGSVTIPSGLSSVTVDLIAVDDPWFEPTETATFDVAGGTGYVAGGTAAKVDVLDDDAATTTVSLVPTYLTLDEGKAGTLTVRRSGGSSASLAATVQLANNPAVAVRAGLNSDYTVTDSAGNAVVVTSNKFPVTFADGESEVTFTVAAEADNRSESEEGVRFQLLSGGSAFSLGNSTSDLTIRDATPQVSISPSGLDLTEGGSGSFTVSRTGPTAGGLAVTVRVEANPAFPTRAGTSDYTVSMADGTVLTVSGGAFTVTIPDGQDSVSFDLKAKTDGVIEDTEGMRLRVATGTTYAAASVASTADVSIADATPQVSITPSTTEVAEGASGTLTLTRTGDASGPLVVTLRAETNPAFPTRAAWNTDYTLYSLTLPNGTAVPLVSGAFTVTIPEGESSLSLSVNGLPDNKTEVTEGVRFRVAGNMVYAAKPGETTADIALIDRTPVVTISPSSLTIPEGSSGSFTVTWASDGSDMSSDRVVTLQLAANPNAKPSATWNTDYTLLVDGQTLAVSGGKFTVTIPSGSNRQTVSIVANTDARVEGPEGVRVQVASGTVYAAGGSPLDAVIEDDPPTVSVTGSTDAAEGGTAGTFTLTRSGGDLSQPLTAWFTLDGTADATWDYAVTGATYVASRDQYRVTFPASSSGSPTSVVVTLSTVDGDCPELDETVELSVVSDSPRYLASSSQGMGSLAIVDNDVTPDMVAPGKTWTDGSSVEVFNPGDTWLRASVVDAGWVQLSPVACGETGPATQNDYFAVVSGLNGFDGDATWIGDVAGLSLTASGDINDLTIAGTVTYTLPGGGSLNQPTRIALDAGQSMGNVNAGEVISLKAVGTIGDVTAKWSVGDVVSIAGSVGNLTAAHDIRGDVTAADDIGNVGAGNQISGEITTGGNIASITVGESNSAAATPVPESGGLDTPLWVVDEAAGIYAWGSLPANAPGYGVTGYAVAGLTGEVNAGGNIGSVVVFGQISRSVSAGGMIGITSDPDTRSGVWAQGAVAGAITAGAGDLTVRSWFTVDGAVSAPGAVEVWGYADVTGSVASTGLTATVGSWGDVTGGVSAPGLIDVRAFGSVGQDSLDKLPTGKQIESTEDAVRVWAGDVAAAPVAALTYAAVYGRNKVQSDGTFKATEGDVSITSADGDVTGGNSLTDYLRINAGRNAEITAGGHIVGVDATAVGNVTLSADKSISRFYATAGNNVWAAAKDGDLDGVFVASEGWAYVWASGDINGSVIAWGTVSATAGNDLAAGLESQDDGVEAFAGRDLTGDVMTPFWASVEASRNVSGKVEAGGDGVFGEITIQAGGDISGKAISTGTIDLAATGSVTGGAEAAEGWLDVTANGIISGDYRGGESASLWSGDSIAASIASEGNVSVTAGGSVLSRDGGVRSIGGSVTVHAGGDISQSMDTTGGGTDIFIEATGKLTGGLSLKAGHDVAIRVNGDIESGVRIEGEWVVDVMSAAGQVNGEVVTRKSKADRLNDPNSPTKRRLDVIDTQLATLRTDSVANAAAITALEAEKELHQLQEKSTDYQRIPAARVRQMIDDGLVKEYSGPAVGEWPFRQDTTGYVVLADVVGGNGYSLVLEPIKVVTYSGEDDFGPWTRTVEESLVGRSDIATTAEYYRVASRFDGPLGPDTSPSDFVAAILQADSVKLKAESVAFAKYANTWEVVKGVAEFAVHIVPVAGAVDDFIQGKYLDAGISLAGDAAMLIGLGAAVKGAKCVYSGSKVIKFARGASLALEGGVAATQTARGFIALNSPDPNERAKAWGYFGDATLRLFGLSAQTVSWLKNKPKCFAAGTLVHTADGSTPIEKIRPGTRVWAFDRQSGHWRLCPVLQTFENVSGGGMATVRLDTGDDLTGTDGHPVWVIEGDELDTRGRPDHGADEPDGVTPGRWVPLAAMRSGDAVLTRDGPAFVTEVVPFHAPLPVYNLEVAGLHAYAVGSAGVLTHNHGGVNEVCELGNWTANPVTKGSATPPPVKPAVSAPKAKQPPATAPDPVPNAAPPAGTTAPTTTPATRDPNLTRPRSNNDKRVTHQYEVVPQATSGTKPLQIEAQLNADAALQSKVDVYNAAKNAKDPNALKAAGEALGDSGATRYMEKNLGATRVAKPANTAGGQFDLDQVYQKDGIFYIVETKGPKATTTTRQVPGENVVFHGKEVPAHAIQGSPKYLELTLKSMAADGSPTRSLALQLQTALEQGKVVYLQVRTVARPNGSAYFSVKQYKLPAPQ